MKNNKTLPSTCLKIDCSECPQASCLDGAISKLKELKLIEPKYVESHWRHGNTFNYKI